MRKDTLDRETADLVLFCNALDGTDAFSGMKNTLNIFFGSTLIAPHKFIGFSTSFLRACTYKLSFFEWENEKFRTEEKCCLFCVR